ncbi:MAG: hypothetical protein AAF652_19885, partial [Cyanobacteria bacterium P01_C01_bin.72]
MSKIKFRTIFVALSLLLLSAFLVSKVAVNLDSSGDRQPTIAVNSDLPESSIPVSTPLRQTSDDLDELYQQAAAAQPDLVCLRGVETGIELSGKSELTAIVGWRSPLESRFT